MTTATTTRTRSKSRATRAAEVAKRDQAPAEPATPAPQENTPPPPAAPKEPTASERRALVFAALIKAAGDLVERWDDARVTRDEARGVLAHRLSYTPGKLADLWDSRLGPVPTGRGKTAAD